MKIRFFRTFGGWFWKFLIFDLIFEIFLCKHEFYKGKCWKSIFDQVRRDQPPIFIAASGRSRRDFQDAAIKSMIRPSYEELEPFLSWKIIKSSYLENLLWKSPKNVFFGISTFLNFSGKFLRFFFFRPHFRNFLL